MRGSWRVLPVALQGQTKRRYDEFARMWADVNGCHADWCFFGGRFIKWYLNIFDIEYFHIVTMVYKFPQFTLDNYGSS